MKTSKPVFIAISIILISLVLFKYGCKKENNGSCSDSNTPPVAAFTFSPASGDTETNFLFDASASSDNEDPTSVLEVRWDWNNDGVWDTDWSSDKNVNHSFETEGVFNVSMEVKDTGGLKDAASENVEVEVGGEPPDPDFSASLTSGTVPLTVSFNDLSTNSPSAWLWDFGDGETSTGQNPSHTYTTPGDYTVSLTATNDYGSETEVRPDYIEVLESPGEPCPGTPTVTDADGNIYNTVLIGTQCWMKENLRYETGNSWCYDDNPSNCETYGRLYDWETIMNGESSSNSVPSGVRGICPEGWHLPSDNEWKILEGAVDSQYGQDDPEWDLLGDFRGFDAAMRMKATKGWVENNGTDALGFTALPAGWRVEGGGYSKPGRYSTWWSSTERESQFGEGYIRFITSFSDEVWRSDENKNYGYSVRCIKD